MEYSELRTGKTLVLAPRGRIDMASADGFRDRLLPLVRSAGEKKEALVLDFSGVDYISSAGLRVLMVAAKEARACGAKIAIGALQPVVSEVFQISRFDKVLNCHPYVGQAVAALNAAA